jgi:murein DD-endopeptidase MepM/ murein hydrolase activator NlpD
LILILKNTLIERALRNRDNKRCQKRNWFKGLLFLSMGIFLPTMIYGQDSLSFNEVFMSPVDHKIKLAGSFGELRANHFHAGIDIKSSRGDEGDTIRATLSGFVSRIKIQRGGYGQVLYIDHPNGFTSVYAHLQQFAPKMQSFITERQLHNKSYEIDIYPEKGDFTFDQGEPIGIMGNTGRSYGPHLHFEIRKTENEVPENPYLHDIGPEDTRPPLLFAVEAHGLNNEHQKIWSRSQSVTPESITAPVTFEVPAWRAGFAIQTFDLMDGASNKNGIYSIEMRVDDTVYYRHVMDRVGFHHSKYINSHVDYGEKKANNRTLTKCYISPGNELEFYFEVKNMGEIKLFKDKSRKVEFLIKDYKGNTTSYHCFLKRREAKEGEIVNPTFQKYLRQGESAKIKLGSCNFFFPKNAFDKNTYISYEEKILDEKIAFNINDNTQPLFSYPVVSIPLNGLTDTSLYDKVVLLYEGKSSYGGHIENDSLRVRIGAFGEYSVVHDTIAPTIDVGSFLSNAVGKPYFRFAIYDNYEAIGYASEIKYDVYIDGEWVVASLKALGNILIVPLSEIQSGGHTIKLRVEDAVGNVTLWERDFIN